MPSTEVRMRIVRCPLGDIAVSQPSSRRHAAPALRRRPLRAMPSKNRSTVRSRASTTGDPSRSSWWSLVEWPMRSMARATGGPLVWANRAASSARVTSRSELATNVSGPRSMASGTVSSAPTEMMLSGLTLAAGAASLVIAVISFPGDDVRRETGRYQVQRAAPGAATESDLGEAVRARVGVLGGREIDPHRPRLGVRPVGPALRIDCDAGQGGALLEQLGVMAGVALARARIVDVRPVQDGGVLVGAAAHELRRD